MGYFAKFNTNGVSFMDDREKGNIADICDMPLHIADFAFIVTRNGDCAVAVFREIPNKFYFMPTVVSEMLKQVEADGQRSALDAAAITIEKRTAKKSGNEYYGFSFKE